MPGAVVVRHEYGDIVTGIADVVVDKQFGPMLGNIGTDSMQQLS